MEDTTVLVWSSDWASSPRASLVGSYIDLFLQTEFEAVYIDVLDKEGPFGLGAWHPQSSRDPAHAAASGLPLADPLGFLPSIPGRVHSTMGLSWYAPIWVTTSKGDDSDDTLLWTNWFVDVLWYSIDFVGSAWSPLLAGMDEFLPLVALDTPNSQLLAAYPDVLFEQTMANVTRIPPVSTPAHAKHLGKTIFPPGWPAWDIGRDKWEEWESFWIAKVDGGLTDGARWLYTTRANRLVHYFTEDHYAGITLYHTPMYEELNGGDPDVFARMQTVHNYLLHPRRVVDVPLLYFQYRYTDFYYHLLIESLPRLLLSLEWLEQNPDVHVLVAWDVPTFEFFHELGLSDRLVVQARDEWIESSVGMYVARPPIPFKISVEGAALMYKTFVVDRNLDTPHRKASLADPVIFLQRTKRRMIVNEDQVLAYLRDRYGDRLVVFSDSVPLPSARTRSLFARAGIVIGVSGAGMANLVFTPRKQAVALVENVAPGGMCLCHYHTVMGVGGRHYYLTDVNATEWLADQVMDVPQLDLLLHKVESQRAADLAHLRLHPDSDPRTPSRRGVAVVDE